MTVTEEELQDSRPPQPTPYADGVGDWRDAGWKGVLPLPPGKKAFPPRRFTGEDGRWPDAQEINEWRHGSPDSNLCVRPPPTVIGIDVDHYDDKRGGDTFFALQSEWGALPDTYISTSRDYPSGIRLFRVPAGTRLINKINSATRLEGFPGGGLPGGIDIIQHHHRYLVAAPSRVEDRVYGLISPDGERCGPPRENQLPALPDTWITNLTAPSVAPGPADYPPADEHREADWDSSVIRVFENCKRSLQDLTSGRHDEAASGVMGLARLEQLGDAGATSAIDALKPIFVAAVTRAAAGQRKPEAAEREWKSLVDTARVKVRNTASTRPEFEDIDDLFGPSSHACDDPPEEDSPPDDQENDLDDWAFQDLGPVLRGEIVNPEPTILVRDDGAGLLYPGRVNGIHGDSGLGKSWVFAMVIAQEIRAGRHAGLIDFEDPNASTIVARLRVLGLTEQQIEDQFHYANPKSPASRRAVTSICEQVTGLGITVIGLDSLGEAFSLEGINEDRDVEVGPWLRAVPRRVADSTGAAVVVIDHITKSADNPMHASGTKRKRAAIGGAGYLLTAPEPMSKDRGGRLTLTCTKDRHGNYRRNELVAHLDFTVEPDGTMSCTVLTPKHRDAAPVAVDLHLAARAATEAVRTDIDECCELPSTNAVMATMSTTFKGATDKKRAGLELAIQKGAIKAQKDSGQAILHRYVEPYEDARRRHDDRA